MRVAAGLLALALLAGCGGSDCRDTGCPSSQHCVKRGADEVMVTPGPLPLPVYECEFIVPKK